MYLAGNDTSKPSLAAKSVPKCKQGNAQKFHPQLSPGQLRQVQTFCTSMEGQRRRGVLCTGNMQIVACHRTQRKYTIALVVLKEQRLLSCRRPSFFPHFRLMGLILYYDLKSRQENDKTDKKCRTQQFRGESTTMCEMMSRASFGLKMHRLSARAHSVLITLFKLHSFVAALFKCFVLPFCPGKNVGIRLLNHVCQKWKWC